MSAGRAELEGRWLQLTRVALPEVAVQRGWLLRFDHCFQRVLLDAACGCCWYERIEGRPAYRHAPGPVLVKAVELGEALLAGTADLPALNRKSLALRGRLRTGN
ncbi:MAG: hypothetical protein AVDCRST_MAG09-692 [uncultured Sphingomonas sp.]|uniref:GCN5-related N-acetyltransferase n=1 Tax=uncultured Sphingomonas sp. TaxID=158754 RepID=A0A6J4S360_9SPHN|nr:GCN5-related N-acetyltransferase [uncultured Sphingomonas sp.]CAA9488539.1 MAG: hypothetical protein AVDCRST_MAG09-692 [uncultured Sphingomonas sp.]